MKKKLIKRQFGGLLNLFKSSENPLLKAPDYSGQKIPPRGNYTKMGPLEIDTPVDNNTYGPYNLPGVTVTAPNLKKAQLFPYGQINVEANNGKTLAYPSGNSPLQEAVFRNKAKRQIAGNRGQLFQNGGSFNGLPLSFIQQFQLNQTNPLTGKKPEVKGWEINDGQFDVLTAQEGDKLPSGNFNKTNKFQIGGEVKQDNTKVQKPIPGIIRKDTRIGMYDNIPVRVDNNYPYNDKWQLEAPTRSINLPYGNTKMNVKYPHVYGVELTSLLPQYVQLINNKDTSYYVQGKNDKYYPVAGQTDRPIFRNKFNKKASKVSESSYFRIPYSLIKE